MTTGELEALLAIALPAAREAGALAGTGFRRRVRVEHKGPVDLVTAYDRESEALLLRRLGPLGMSIVAEEGGRVLEAGRPALFVDPIDGTTNFVHGHPFWCVSVGLAVGPLPVLGIVVAPALGLEWWGYVAEDDTRCALRAEGPTVDRCAVSSTPALGSALLATGFPYDRTPGPGDNIGAFSAIQRLSRGVRRCGSAAIDLAMVADGTFDGYWERGLRPWDVAGGAALVRGAGGRVTELEGGPAFLDSGNILATNGLLHEALVSVLASRTS